MIEKRNINHINFDKYIAGIYYKAVLQIAVIINLTQSWLFSPWYSFPATYCSFIASKMLPNILGLSLYWFVAAYHLSTAPQPRSKPFQAHAEPPWLGFW